MPTIDELQIEITHSSEKAVSGIDGLINSLTRLKGVTRGGVGLTSVANQLGKLNDAASGIKDPTENIQKLVSALKPLESIQKTNLNSTLNVLKKVPEIVKVLSTADMGGKDFLGLGRHGFAGTISDLVKALEPLEKINKNNLNSTINALKKLPDITKQLSEIDMDGFASRIESGNKYKTSSGRDE